MDHYTAFLHIYTSVAVQLMLLWNKAAPTGLGRCKPLCCLMLWKPCTSGAEPHMQVQQLGSQSTPQEVSYKNVDLCTQRLKQLLSPVH